MTVAHTCPKCKSAIKTKLLGENKIKVTCECPHEMVFQVHDFYRDEEKKVILEFQKERKSDIVKEVKKVKEELLQCEMELAVNNEEYESLTIEEAELLQFKKRLESEDEEQERIESDGKKFMCAADRETYPRAYRTWTPLQNQVLKEFVVSQSGIENVQPADIESVIRSKGCIKSWNTKEDLLGKASKLFGRKETAMQKQLREIKYWDEPGEKIKFRTSERKSEPIGNKPPELVFGDEEPEGFEGNEQKNQIISEIKNAYKNKKKYVIVSAPTGSGKSWIAAKISLMLGQGTILTEQKSLQGQYIEDFKFMNQVKGKNNFDCAKHMMEKKCSEGNCDNCEYKCTSTDFSIKNPGKDEEVSVNNENFIPVSSLSGSKLELNSSKMQINDNDNHNTLADWLLDAEQRQFLDDADDSWTFAIEHNNTIYFVLPDDRIPYNATLCKNSSGDPILQKKEMCRYWMQREIGKKSSFSVYNYSAYLSTRLYDGRKEKSEINNQKKVLICDEAQHLPERLAEETTIEIKYKFFKKLEMYDKVERCKKYASENQTVKVVEVLKDMGESCKDERDKISKCKECLKFLKSRNHINEHRTADNCIKHKTLQTKKCKGCRKFKESFVDKNEQLKCSTHHKDYDKKVPCEENHSSMTDEWINELKKNTSQLESNLNLIELYSKQNKKNLSEILVCENKSYDKKSQPYAIKITPVEEGIAADILFETYPLVIFISSTIDKKLFCSELQIDEKDTEYLSYESKIDRSRRKIYKNYQGEPLYARIANQEPTPQYTHTIKKITERIEEIMKEHPDERGLILVNSGKEHEDIIRLIQDPELKKRLTYRNRQPKDSNEIQKSNEEILEEHKHPQKPNSVMISPSMWEGVDLKGDYGRFCIVAKAPYAPGRGALADAKKNLRPKQRDTEDFFKLIQGCGRCTRSTDDQSVTYLLDKGCDKLVERMYEYQNEHKDYNVKWFTDAISEYR